MPDPGRSGMEKLQQRKCEQSGGPYKPDPCTVSIRRTRVEKACQQGRKTAWQREKRCCRAANNSQVDFHRGVIQ